MSGGLEQKYNKNIENIKREINIADFFGAIFLRATNLIIINSVSTTLNNNFNQQNSSLKMWSCF